MARLPANGGAEGIKRGIGVVIRDKEGAVLGAYASSKICVGDPFMIEVSAVLSALEFALHMGFISIELEGMHQY
ncbi:hypothetical protein CRYUN_Cryun12cG0048400 [Craigia yunnanensis]